MFSEYASRFLAQSQSRISNAGQPDPPNSTSSRQTRAGPLRGQRLASGRSVFGDRGNPYQSSGGSRFGQLNLASRYLSSQREDAPLFQSARDDLRDDEDEEERDREAADLYALQRSRRVFSPTRLAESSEPEEDDGNRTSLDQSVEDTNAVFGDDRPRRGIESSWTGRRSSPRSRQEKPPDPQHETVQDDKDAASEASSKGKMVDIGLESVIEDHDPPKDLTMEAPIDDPPAIQHFRTTPQSRQFALRRDSTIDPELGPPPSESIAPSIAGAPAPSDGEIFKHDTFFAWIYLISLAGMFATYVLVWLHTSPLSGKRPYGDTIYTALESSFHLLAVDTLVAIIVSLVWLAALRSFVRPLVGLILVGVPIILVSFSLYPLVSSYQGREHGGGLQDAVMRWASLVPAIGAAVWLYLVYKGRYALSSAIAILEFSSRVLAANYALVLVGMGCLATIVIWTWVWLVMFARIFLGGSYSDTLARFIIQSSSWWLGASFIMMYIWTLSVISGVQRGTTAATVSQWYFHRNAVPAPSSRDVVGAAFSHAITTIFGTISFSTLLALLIRLPLLILPRRLASLIAVGFYSFMPTSVAALTNPLTLTYSAIHSMSLNDAARGLSQLDFLSPQVPTTTLTPRAFRRGSGTSVPLLPYRLAKLLLHATRFIMAISLGFAGWVITARQLQIAVPEGSLRGSAYAYIVGLVASFIGWGILGAMEGILSGIVDAVVICYGSETRMAVGGGGYCIEAAQLFGGADGRAGSRSMWRNRRDGY